MTRPVATSFSSASAADLDLAEAERLAAAQDAGVGEQLLGAGGGEEVDREADRRPLRRLAVELDRRPGGGHRRGVDQGGDRAAVDHVADRHHLLGEGQAQHRAVVLDLAQLHAQVPDELRVFEERRDQLGAAHDYFGGIRRAPSSRIVSPFSIVLATISATSRAYSSGRPSREGCGIPAPSACRCLLRQRREHRRVEQPRGDRHRPGSRATARSRAAGRVIPTMPPFEAE